MKYRLFISFLFATTLLAAQPADSLAIKLDQLIEGYASVYGFTGTAMVVLEDKKVFEQSYGLANRSFGIPNQLDTRFSINSISKTFTALGILMLAEEGKLRLEDAVGQHLPSLTASWKDSVTIHHLLSHSSGLPRESGVQASDELSLKAQVKLVEELDLLFAPGMLYGYSNAGIILLGAILEQASGQPFATFVETEIIQPLGLKHTGVYQGRNVVEKQAVPYRFTANGLEYAQRAKHFGENAGGGLYSTVSNLYQYILAIESHQLLSPAWTKLLFTPHYESGGLNKEGYCWSIKQFGAETIYMASGSGYGTKSVIIREPASGTYIGITSNWGNTPVLKLLADLYLLTKGESISPPERNSLAKADDFEDWLGTYTFDPAVLQQHLMMDKHQLKLHSFDGKVFLDDELMAKKPDGKLGLTYTDELLLWVDKGKMTITINGNTIVSQ
jgi:CubicO group peptidase (beta-lactamase class C family)